MTNINMRVAKVIQRQGTWIENIMKLLSCARKMMVYEEKSYTTQIFHMSVRKHYEKILQSFPFNTKCCFIKNGYSCLDHPV